MLDKNTAVWFNSFIQKPLTRKKGCIAHLQRAPGAESGVKSGAVHGPPRAGGTGLSLVSSDAEPALWAGGVLASQKSGRSSGNQGGTADTVVIRPWQVCSARGAFYFRRERS